MEVTGKLAAKFPTQQITDSFKKQEFVIEFADNPEYPELYHWVGLPRKRLYFG